jgi:hypothetical protein
MALDSNNSNKRLKSIHLSFVWDHLRLFPIDYLHATVSMKQQFTGLTRSES